jgi:simple sugar transport system ATP-binding protein
MDSFGIRKSIDLQMNPSENMISAAGIPGRKQVRFPEKLVLARELYRNPRLIIAVQPTRGLDVGATHFVHSMLLEQMEKGCAILLISTELDEILTISNRISAIYEGKLMGTFNRTETDRESLGLLMAGKSL